MCGDNEIVSLNLGIYLGLEQCPLVVVDQFSDTLSFKKSFKQLILVLMLLSLKIRQYVWTREAVARKLATFFFLKQHFFGLKMPEQLIFQN